jgi:hypothetical protein
MEPKGATAVLEKTVEKHNFEDRIRKNESLLGLHSEYDRQLEASLFIDKKFLSYALITGTVNRPERVFGDKLWADYLEARVLAKEYGNTELTPEFILILHKALSLHTDPHKGGVIRDFGVIGGAYDNPGEPVEYTDLQIKTIENNPKLNFRRELPDDPDSKKGMIVYPHRGNGRRVQGAVLNDLKELCDWFNKAKKQDNFSPHIVAGVLQHRLVSLHPFGDFNGTLSRVLMNWSLEADAQAPSVLDNPGADILTDEETWVSHIRDGSQKYTEFKRRQRLLQEAGIDEITSLFDLGYDKAFYDYIFRHMREAPPLPTNGDRHHHQTYELFLQEFKGEMERFQKYMQRVNTYEHAGEKREITQGGLILPEYIKFAASDRAQSLPLEIRSELFSDTPIYRGGLVDEEIDDAKLCQMFVRYTAVGTGYRTLQRSHASPISLRRVSSANVRESMEYYNKMFASTYFKDQHPERPNPYQNMYPEVKDMNDTVRGHIGGGEEVWDSPFASTSLDYWQAHYWGTRLGSLGPDIKAGVVIKASLPKQGTVLTFGEKFGGLSASGMPQEYEALVTGAVQPASVTEIEMYSRSTKLTYPNLVATRVDREGKRSVLVEDRNGQFVVERMYDFDPQSGQFQLVSTNSTERLSTDRRELPMPRIKHEIGSYMKYLGGTGDNSGYFGFDQLLDSYQQKNIKEISLTNLNMNKYYHIVPISANQKIIGGEHYIDNINKINLSFEHKLIENMYPDFGLDSLTGIMQNNSDKPDNIQYKIPGDFKKPFSKPYDSIKPDPYLIFSGNLKPPEDYLGLLTGNPEPADEATSESPADQFVIPDLHAAVAKIKFGVGKKEKS